MNVPEIETEFHAALLKSRDRVMVFSRIFDLSFESKGSFPLSLKSAFKPYIKYMITPMLHRSACVPYPCFNNTSGAT